MTDQLTDEAVTKLANDCVLAANCMEAEDTFPTGQGILREAARALLDARAQIAVAEARGMQEGYRKACVAVRIMISRNTPDDGGDADPYLIDQLEGVESLIKREAAAILGEGK